MSENENIEKMDELDEPMDAQKEEIETEAVEHDSDKSSDNTVTFKRSHLYAALLPLAFAVGLAFGYIFWGSSDGFTEPAPEVAQAPSDSQGQAAPQGAEPTPELRRYDVPEDDDPALGPETAPITIIEFSDYECPYCRSWHQEVWPSLQAEYGDQVRLVYRDFPLKSIHSNATPAAAAANCAREQDMYWEYNEMLFSMKYNLSTNSYRSYADELGLNMTEFNECLDSDRYIAEVEADYEYAANLGIRSTPTFFVNGIPVVGAQPFEVFKNLIDQELAGELPK